MQYVLYYLAGAILFGARLVFIKGMFADPKLTEIYEDAIRATNSETFGRVILPLITVIFFIGGCMIWPYFVLKRLLNIFRRNK